MAGRKKTTGRYETREELARQVWAWYAMPGTTVAQIARIAKVSEGVVHGILNSREGVGN